MITFKRFMQHVNADVYVGFEVKFELGHAWP
jgi:hypothetical protein